MGSLDPGLERLQKLLVKGDEEGLCAELYGMVSHLANSYKCDDLPWDDALQAGYIGLIRAIRLHDPEKHDPRAFLKFAKQRVRWEIAHAFREAKPVKIPGKGDLWHFDDGGRKIIAKAERRFKSFRSLDEPLFDGEEGHTLGEALPTPPQFQTIVTDEQLKIKLRRAMSALNERQRQVLELRYGLNGKPELTTCDTAEELGIHHSSVSLTEKEALAKLRRHEELLSSTQSEALLGIALKALTKQQREVIVLKYGLEGNRKHTTGETAKALDMLPTHVSRSERRALNRLREYGELLTKEVTPGSAG